MDLGQKEVYVPKSKLISDKQWNCAQFTTTFNQLITIDELLA